jgi:hypothetical protein
MVDDRPWLPGTCFLISCVSTGDGQIPSTFLCSFMVPRGPPSNHQDRQIGILWIVAGLQTCRQSESLNPFSSVALQLVSLESRPQSQCRSQNKCNHRIDHDRNKRPALRVSWRYMGHVFRSTLQSAFDTNFVHKEKSRANSDGAEIHRRCTGSER